MLSFPTTPKPPPHFIQDAIITAEVRPAEPSKPLPIYELKEAAEVDFIRPVEAVDSSGDNTYPAYPFQCTRYAKQKRPDIPNNLGNANLWYYRLKAMGWPVGLEPRAGAIGQQGMHVVYIEKVEGDRVYLSERNWDYHGSYRERWADASSFLYIY